MNTLITRTHHLTLGILSAVLFSLSGCANFHSIHRTSVMPGQSAQITYTDAKQRGILFSRLKHNEQGKTEEQLRFCAEPSPDVFSTIASSLALEASGIFGPTQKEAAAKLASTVTENAATIERSQTLNILRESMYRTCERYLSGAISTEEFIVQAARDQRAMVHILAIEQLTSTARAQATAITTQAKAGAEATSESLKVMQEAKVQADKLAANALNADKAVDKASLKTSCADLTKQDESEENKEKKGLCANAITAKKDAEDASSHYNAIRQAVSRMGTVNTSAQGDLSNSKQSQSIASNELAGIVLEIVKQNNDFNELEMTCVVVLRGIRPTRNQSNKDFASLYETCKPLLNALSNQQALRINKSSLFELSNTQKQLEKTLGRQINTESVWAYIQTQRQKGQSDAAIEAAINKELKAKLRSNPDAVSGVVKSLSTASSLEDVEATLEKIAQDEKLTQEVLNATRK